MIGSFFWRAAIASGGNLIDGLTGFTSAGTGSYLGRSDSGASLPAAATYTIVGMFTVKSDAALGTSQVLFGKGTDYALGVDASDRLYFQDSQSTLNAGYTLTAADRGKTFLVGMSRENASGCYLYVYRVADDRALVIDGDTAVTTPTTGAQSVAIGAARGDSTGGNESSDYLHHGWVYGTTYLDDAAMSTYMQSCAAANAIVSMTGEVSRYLAPDLEVDLVGSNDFTIVENTPGDIAVTGVSPSYQNKGTFLVGIVEGQSNARGPLDLVDVPTSPVDYTASFPAVQYYEYAVTAGRAWGAIRPLADIHWAWELSLARSWIAAGLDPLWIIKVAAGGTLDEVWATDPPGTMTQSKMDDWDNAFCAIGASDPVLGAERSWDPFKTPDLIFTARSQGEADAGATEAIANRFEDNLRTYVEWSTSDFLIGRASLNPLFFWIEFLLPAWNTVHTYKATINAAKVTVAGEREDMAVVNTDETDHNGDLVHYDAPGLISKGPAAFRCWQTRADAVADSLSLNIVSAIVAEGGATTTLTLDRSDGDLEALTAGDFTYTGSSAVVDSAAWSGGDTIILTNDPVIGSESGVTLAVAAGAITDDDGNSNAAIAAQPVDNSANSGLTHTVLTDSILALRADLGVAESSGDVTAWEDQGASGNDAGNGGAGTYVTYDDTTWPLPVIVGAGGGKYMTIPTAIATAIRGNDQATTYYGLIYRPVGATGNWFGTGSSVGVREVLAWLSSQRMVVQRHDGSSAATWGINPNDVFPEGEWSAFIFRINGDTIDVFVDSTTALATGAAFNTGDTSAMATDGRLFGCPPTTTSPITIAEFGILSSAISDAEKDTKMTEMLAYKSALLA